MKEDILKPPRGKRLITFRCEVILASDYPIETIKARRQINDVFKIPNEYWRNMAE